MSQKFQAAVNHQGDVSYVKLAGVIDEDNELGDLVDRIPAGTAVIDLGEIERINSCGVRDWVNWLSRLETQKTRVVMVECSPAIVAQINLVNNFTGSGVVKSFYVPYFCPECDEEKVLLVDASDMGPPPHEPPTCRCDECDLVMDFDDMPDSYFAFLSNQRKVAEPEKISSAMRALAPASSPGSAAGTPTDKGKIRARASGTPSMGPTKSSLPSVPSLPSIKGQTGSKPGSKPGSQPGGSNPGTGPGGSRPGMPGMKQTGANPGSRPSFSQMGGMSSSAMAMMERPAVTQPRSNALVYVLVIVLLAAIGVLAYLLLTR
jgi:anti-anti-sigma regulatory factor